MYISVTIVAAEPLFFINLGEDMSNGTDSLC